MKKWLYRAVGVASGALLMGNGVAHAATVEEAKPTADPQVMRGLLADLFTPTGGQHSFGLSLDRHISVSGMVPDLTNTLPTTNLLSGQPRMSGQLRLFGQSQAPGQSRSFEQPQAIDQSRSFDQSREELLPGLGLLGGAAGTGGLLSGLTGGGGGTGLVSGLTGGLTGGGGGLLGGLTGGDSPLGGLTGGLTGGGGGPLGGLTGGDGPLGGITGGLTGGGGPLGGITGGLTGSDGPLGGITGGLTGGGGPLGGLTGGGGPLGGITGGLTGGGGPLGGITGGLAGAGGPLGGLTGGLLGGDRAVDDDAQVIDIDPTTLQQLVAASGTGSIGTAGPASTDIVDPALRGTALDTSNQQPIQLDPALARQVNDATNPMISKLIADAMAKQAVGTSDFDFDPNAESLPLVGGMPLVGSLIGPGGPLSQFLVIGDMFQNLPVVSDLTRGGLNLDSVDRLPVVGKILNQGMLQAGDGPALPIVGSLPLLGGALNGLTQPLTQAGGGALNGLTQPLNPSGSATPGAVAKPLPTQPGAQVPIPVAVPNQNAAASPNHIAPARQVPNRVAPARQVPNRVAPASPSRIAPAGLAMAKTGIQRPGAAQLGKHRAPTDTARPVVADPEFGPESGSLPLPIVGSLLDGGSMGTLPVSSIVRQLPLVSDLPLISSLSAPLGLLRSMPVVGMLAGLVPVENA